MLTIISTLSFIMVGSLFPLFLWIIVSVKIDPGFHRFTLGLSSLIGGFGVIFFWFMDVELRVQLLAIVWLISLLTVTWFYWGRRNVQVWVVTIPSLLGVIVYSQMESLLISPGYLLLVTSILGGLILCGSIFSVLLGHSYFKMANLSIGLLMRAVKCLLVFLILRILWDIPYLFMTEVDLADYVVPAVEFIQSFNGFFLFIALFFGTALPLILCVLTLRTVSIHSARSAMGLLYVLLISVIIGDLFYKYYAIHFSLFF